MPDNHSETHPVVQIDVTNRVQVRRYRCPNGHSSWEPTNGGVWCPYCARDGDVEDPHYHELVDWKTDKSIDWERIQLVGRENKTARA